MDALLRRMWFPDGCTIGEFFLDRDYQCYMLEDVARKAGIKVVNETAIPSGLIYKIGKVFSPKHKMIVPVTYTDKIGDGTSPGHYIIKDPFGNVWEAVEIHPGNDAADTDACQLPGLEKSVQAQTVSFSRKACQKIYPLIMEALQTQEFIPYQIINSTPDQAHDYHA